MEIIRNLSVPTGNILVVDGDHGQLELLSIGDYGKDVNLKCDSMGLTRDIDHVEHQQMLPLEEKWVITISTQYGCAMRCSFCDVPKAGTGRNATYTDLVGQLMSGMSIHPEVTWTKRLNIHYARMGEPTWNPAVLEVSRDIPNLFLGHRLHPVVSTMMPRNNKWLEAYLRAWMSIKNDLYEGEAGLQLSINSTNEEERSVMFGRNAHTLSGIASIMHNMPKPKGRKITLNFAVANYTVDPFVLLQHFDPDRYIIKLTPMHKTDTAIENGIETQGDYCSSHPYEELEGKLKAAGYEVIVFVTSFAEDAGLITCGNAILSGSLPRTEYEELAV